MSAHFNRKKSPRSTPLVIPSSGNVAGVQETEGRARACHLHNLRKPAPENDLIKLSPYPSQKGQVRFETLASAREEDRHRVKSLRMHAGGKGKGAKRTYLALADRIEAEEATLASSVFNRRFRRRLVGELLRHVRLLPAGSWATVTLLPASWTVHRSELLKTDPGLFLGRLRSWMNKAGVSGADGFLIAFLDVEYDPQNEVFHFHIHALATGDHLRILRDLDVSELEHVPGQRPPIRVRKVQHPEAALSYLVKSYCSGKIRPDGSRGRHRRILEPQHSHFLRWQDRLVLSDLTLLMGCRVTGQVLKVDHPPAYTKHDPSYSKLVKGKDKVASTGGIDANDGPVGADSDGGGLEHRPPPATVNGAGASKATGRRGDGATKTPSLGTDSAGLPQVMGLLRDQTGGLWIEVGQGAQSILIPRAAWENHSELSESLEVLGSVLLRRWKARADDQLERLMGKACGTVTVAAYPGWLGSAFVMPDGTVSSPEGHQPPRLGFRAHPPATPTAGDLARWVSRTERLLRHQPLPRFCLAASLIGPLLEPLQIRPNIGFELVGEGGGFKGALLALMASLWGPFADKSWKTTPNALEDAMAGCRDCFVAFDEAATFTDGSPAAAGEKVRYAVFTLAEGKLKARMGRPPVSGYVSLAWASASNQPLSLMLKEVRASTSAAAGSRLISIRADGEFGTFDQLPAAVENVSDLAVAVRDLTSTAKGMPARRFVERLVAEREQDEARLIRRVRRHISHFMAVSAGGDAKGMDHRVLFYFGLVYAAGRLAKGYGCLPAEWNMESICLAAFNRMDTAAVSPTSPTLKPLQDLRSSLANAKLKSLHTRRIMSDRELDDASGIMFSQSGRLELLIRTARGRSDFPNWTALLDEAVRQEVLITTAGGERQVKRHVRSNPREKSGDRFYAFDVDKLATAN